MTTKPRAALAALLFLALGAGLTFTMPAVASTPVTHVTIGGFAFSPGSATTPIGGTVSWTNQDSVAHTSTSDQGFWSSPDIGNGVTWSHRFNSAGTFPYHCAIHPDMHGSVSAPMRVAPRAGGALLTWSVGAGRFDVQMEKPGTHRWVTYRSSTTARGATFRAMRAGRYLFRARTRMGSITSGWSPTAVVSVR